MTSLSDYAREELSRAGLFDKDGDYDGKIGEHVMEIVEVFKKGGHSGSSAFLTIEILNKVLRYEPLTPLTYEPNEWEDRSDMSSTPLWQNKRDSKVFSIDGGKTHHRLGERGHYDRKQR